MFSETLQLYQLYFVLCLPRVTESRWCCLSTPTRQQTTRQRPPAVSAIVAYSVNTHTANTETDSFPYLREQQQLSLPAGGGDLYISSINGNQKSNQWCSMDPIMWTLLKHNDQLIFHAFTPDSRAFVSPNRSDKNKM